MSREKVGVGFNYLRVYQVSKPDWKHSYDFARRLVTEPWKSPFGACAGSSVTEALRSLRTYNYK